MEDVVDAIIYFDVYIDLYVLYTVYMTMKKIESTQSYLKELTIINFNWNVPLSSMQFDHILLNNFWIYTDV